MNTGLFLDMSKTEREFAVNAQKYLETNGFVPLSSKGFIKSQETKFILLTAEKE